MKIIKWLLPGMRIKRWIFLSCLGMFFVSFGLAIFLKQEIIGQMEKRLLTEVYQMNNHYFPSFSFIMGFFLLLLGLSLFIIGFRAIIRSILSAILPNGEESLVEALYQKRQLEKGAKIVVVGGGTGLSNLLRGLKRYSNNLTAVVTVADDGGSSGRLRRELGILPPGDIRNCMTALADKEPLMEKLFQYRFQEGSLAGHNFGNLFIAAMNEITGDFLEVLKESSKVLAVKGRVFPSTLDSVVLKAKLYDGTIISGETEVGKHGEEIEELFLEPDKVTALPEAIESLLEADAIILGPGSLYTSIMPNILIPEIVEAIQQSSASKIYVCNVMTQKGETETLDAVGHVARIVDKIGSGVLDYVVVNNKDISMEMKEKYAKEGSQPVKIDRERLNSFGVEVIEADVVNQTEVVRHNPVKLAKVLLKIITKNRTQWDRRSVVDLYLLERLMR